MLRLYYFYKKILTKQKKRLLLQLKNSCNDE